VRPSTGTNADPSFRWTVTTTGFSPTLGGLVPVVLPGGSMKAFARPESATVRLGKAASTGAAPGRSTVTARLHSPIMVNTIAQA
jgi:hypothetical protein